MNRLLASAFLAAAAAAALGACSLTRPSPVKEMYLLAPPALPAAELAITFYVTRPDRSSVPIWTKEYRRRTTLTTVSAASYAAAQSAALGEILAEFARDVAAVK